MDFCPKKELSPLCEGEDREDPHGKRCRHKRDDRAELLGGVKTEKEYERLKSRLDALYYIETNRSLWDYASKLAIHLKRKCVHVPYADILIAASAMQEKAILVHTDAHFDAISKYSELKVESLLAHL
jgi:predicted nucleic acid-binding protein